MQAILFVKTGNESELLSRSQYLGYSEAILVYDSSEKDKIDVNYRKELQKTSKLTLMFGIDCKTKKEARIKGFDVYLQLGTRNNELFSGVTHVYGNEFEQENDFVHQRRSGLNHVLLATCAKYDVSVVLDVSSLQSAKPARQAQLLGRFVQNVKLCKKNKVHVVASTCVSDVKGLRGANDVVAFERVLK